MSATRWLFVLFAFGFTLLPAQVAGRLSGTLADGSGASISGASIKLLLPGGGVAAYQESSSDGLFSFIGLQPGVYDVRAEAAGFAPVNVAGVKVDAARETALGLISLSPATLTQSVDVVAASNAVQTSNVEIASTVTNEQVRRLPQLNRNILALIATQAGVGNNGRLSTTINGLRTSYANVTLDGVNIQDNFLRENSLDFQPNLLLMDQVGELTISTSNAAPSMGGGAAQIAFVTPSGTNRYHGAAYWYNRNNAFAANGFFENRDGIGLPFLNQNQLGGSFSGPIVKNRLFFYVNYEALRRREQQSQQRTILTDSARQGIFTYTDAAGVRQQRNILQLTGNQVDPFMQGLISQLPAASAINNFRTGDSAEGVLRNTGGYSFLQRSNRNRNNATGKLDYYASDRHSFFGTYAWNSDFIDRPTINQFTYTPTPSVLNDNKVNFFSAGWRSTWSANFTNELRGGANFAPGEFLRGTPQEPFYVTSALNTNSLVFSNPQQPYQPQGRNTRTWTLSDNANWVKGRHTISFGFQANSIETNFYDFASTVPLYQVGLGTRNGVTAAMLPGASANDLVQANYLLSSLAGFFDQVTQRFNVESTTSGFVPNQEKRRIYTLATYSGYVQDSWRVNRALTLTAGVRYEYLTRVNEKRNLALLPMLQNGNPIETLLSNSTLDFAGTGVGRPWYGRDGNNFAPHIGLAWNVRGDGKTAIRAGYSVNYVNDNHISTLLNSPDTNDGLAQDVILANISGTASNPTRVTPPQFRVPRTFSDNYALNRAAPFGLIDPGLRTPYVQQWNFSIQQQLAGGVLELRYLGNRGTKQFRAFDYNQVDVRANGFLDDFRRAYNNGVLALGALGRFDPRYNAAIPGSQLLPVFDALPFQGLLTNPTISNLIQTQEAGGLAATYQQFALNGPLNFFPNPVAFGTNMVTNYSNSSWNAFQADYTRRFSRGFSFQMNYTFAKSLSDAAGDNQTNFEPFLDINNAAIERAPTAFDLRHAVKSNFVLDLPFGRGKRYLNSAGRGMNLLAGGWSVSGISTWQSGFPFGIRSQRATLNRAGNRSIQNTATTILDGNALDRAIGFYMTGNGPFIVDPLAIGADGRGVGADGRAPFAGQVFFNPNAGELGALQRRMFQGPSYFNFDFGVQKQFAITEGQTLEFRMESTNFFNNVRFDTTQTPGQTPTVDYNVNSATFGRVITQANTPRRIQFGLYYRF
jgi:hypothetical protein